MISLLLNATKYVLGFVQPAEPDINDVIARIESAEDTTETSVTQQVKSQSEEGCFYKTGRVTVITGDYILVDDLYMCESTNVLVNVKVGDKVYYLAFRRDQNEEERICKVISVIDDTWDNEADEQQDEVTNIKVLKRSVVGKVTNRQGRNMFIEPIGISVDLDKIHSEFIPTIGDWLKLESLVEVDELSNDLGGEVLEVDSIRPLRTKLTVGIVTNYNLATGVGNIDNYIYFNKISCEPGYSPCFGDKVVSDSIESDQGIFTWRSLTVVPLIQVSQKQTLPVVPSGAQFSNNNLDLLLKDKHDIVIMNDLTFNLNMHEEKDIIVPIQNTGKVICTLYKGCFMSKKAQSQLSLVWPTVDTITILHPSETMSYIFKCKARFIGTSEELFIFNFKGFKIGRIFRIIINAQNFTKEKDTFKVGNGRSNKLARQDNYDQATYVQGIRPFKSPAFIKIRRGVFKVPQRYWDAILVPLNEKKSQMEREIAAGDAIPCLLNGLSFENYRDRFHALLYLENIGRIIDMQRYDIDSAIMRHYGEYLILNVPGLAEKRPSLLIGDKAIVSFKWDKSEGKLKYEGYIHKVKSSEVLLKFNQEFHETYNNEDCQVTFKCSQSSIYCCHSAVNLAVTHLGPEFLFPTRVVQKEAQLDLEEVDDTEEKSKYVQLEHKRSHSASSVCSCTSGKSTNDSLSDSTIKSPRISVAERLFNVKPLDSSNASKCSIEQSIPIDMPVVLENGYNKNNVANKMNPNWMHNQSCNPSISHNEERLDAKSKLDSHDIQLDPYILQLKKRKLVWFNKKLNYYQKQAVRNILNGLGRPLPYVIFGPPGTGKTITLCETALQIFTTIPESRLLIATPSNSSANLITERLLDNAVLKPGDLVRLVAHHCLEDDSIPEKLLPYCATGDLADERSRAKAEYSGHGLKINCTASVLGRHRITVGTCIALGLLYNMGFPRGHFSHVLVDEAGQATEPEIMVPLNFIHSSHGQVILAGDPMQLGPVVQSNLANHFGLGESFLRRLLHRFPYQKDPESFETGYDPRLVTKLIMNYRSLPEILELPNSLFYDSELQPQISTKNSEEADLLRLLAADLPERTSSPPAIVFHGIRGENHQDSDSPSWYNPEEATQVYFYLIKLYSHGLQADDIGIITPYQKQVRQIRDLLLELDIKSPKVGSVEEFQGQERKVIILSTVRSASNLITEDIKHTLGFVASPRRMNVAITRARALLIILGNPQLLSQDPYWRSVLIYCMKQEAYTGCDFLPSYLESCLTETDESQSDIVV